MTNQMDTTRKLFLEKQFANLPVDVIGLIREYDSIFKDRFTKHVVNSINLNVNVFWDKKIRDYALNVETMYSPTYIKKLDNYYNILWNVLTIPSFNYGQEGDDLLMID
jgi:hypothetical protein